MRYSGYLCIPLILPHRQKNFSTRTTNHDYRCSFISVRVKIKKYDIGAGIKTKTMISVRVKKKLISVRVKIKLILPPLPPHYHPSRKKIDTAFSPPSLPSQLGYGNVPCEPLLPPHSRFNCDTSASPLLSLTLTLIKHRLDLVHGLPWRDLGS